MAPTINQCEHTSDETNPDGCITTRRARTTPGHSAPHECRCADAGPHKHFIGIWTQTFVGIVEADGKAVSQERGGEGKDAPGVAQFHTRGPYRPGFRFRVGGEAWANSSLTHAPVEEQHCATLVLQCSCSRRRMKGSGLEEATGALPGDPRAVVLFLPAGVLLVLVVVDPGDVVVEDCLHDGQQLAYGHFPDRPLLPI